MEIWTNLLKRRKTYNRFTSKAFIVILLPMLKMRLQRVGRKHEPTFRLVLTDSKNSTKSGRFQEVLGAYDPRKAIDTFNTEKIKALVAQGVGLTGSVNNLLLKHGIIRGKKTHVGSNFVHKEPEAAPVSEEVTPEPAPLNDSSESSGEQSESTVLAEPAQEVVAEPAPEVEEKKEEAAPQEPTPEV